jgi:hypothetical protein
VANFATCTAGFVNTSGKFANGVNEIPAANLPPLTPVAKLPPVSTILAKLVAKFPAGVVDTGGAP